VENLYEYDGEWLVENLHEYDEEQKLQSTYRSQRRMQMENTPTYVETLGTNRGIANKKFFPIIKVVL
jgi:hypothetical protein